MAFEALLPHIKMILTARERGATLDDIIQLLEQQHGVSTSPGTLSRFLKSQSANAPQTAQDGERSVEALRREIVGTIRAELDEQRHDITEQLHGMQRSLSDLTERLNDIQKQVNRLVEPQKKPEIDQPSLQRNPDAQADVNESADNEVSRALEQLTNFADPQQKHRPSWRRIWLASLLVTGAFWLIVHYLVWMN